MSLSQRIGTLAAVAALTVTASADASRRGDLAGKVSSGRSPLPTVTVYAYELANLELAKTVSDSQGGFFFSQLPAGLYKVIAFKRGFAPAVLTLRRASTDSRQFVDLELVPEPTDGRAKPVSFWDVRSQIPGDVLRDIQLLEAEAESWESQPIDRSTVRTASRAPARIETRMGATTGVRESLDFGSADVASAEVGVSGQLNAFAVAFDGRFSELSAQGSDFDRDSGATSGSSQVVSLKLESKDRSRIQVASNSNRLLNSASDAGDIDFEHHRVSWSQAVGRNGRTDVSAQYTSENNYFREALIEPVGIPDASRSLHLSGRYSGNVTKKATIEAGVSYREREIDYTRVPSAFGGLMPQESVELYGRGGVSVLPAMVVQYGLYSTLRDGSLSLSPQGGLMVEFGPNWRASTSFSTRIDADEDQERAQDFLTSFYGDGEVCRQNERYCYELGLSRLLGANQQLSVGAVHRKIGETQRVYFSDDFFNRLDSIYLVDGDTLPELKFELTRRLAPRVLARVQSNVAAGGGGLFRSNGATSAAGTTPYENNVRYLVTSFDTQFEHTSTGVFLAFHHLQQELESMTGLQQTDNPELELERLQLVLSQDLDVLHALASDWAVHLNMELSRGGATTDGLVDGDELRKRVTGGVAVKF